MNTPHGNRNNSIWIKFYTTIWCYSLLNSNCTLSIPFFVSGKTCLSKLRTLKIHSLQREPERTRERVGTSAKILWCTWWYKATWTSHRWEREREREREIIRLKQAVTVFEDLLIQVLPTLQYGADFLSALFLMFRIFGQKIQCPHHSCEYIRTTKNTKNSISRS